jgi:alanine racemase
MSADTAATGALIVDLNALARNYHRLSEAVAPAECSAVVKANAYGLGVAPVTRRLLREGCRSFFVATPAEGTELRAIAPGVAIYVLAGAVEDQVASLLQSELTPVLSSLAQVERWAEAASNRAAALHIDTGMSRLGMTAREVEVLAARPALL